MYSSITFKHIKFIRYYCCSSGSSRSCTASWLWHSSSNPCSGSGRSGHLQTARRRSLCFLENMLKAGVVCAFWGGCVKKQSACDWSAQCRKLGLVENDASSSDMHVCSNTVKTYETNSSSAYFGGLGKTIGARYQRIQVRGQFFSVFVA